MCGRDSQFDTMPALKFHPLTLHPLSRTDAVTRIDVDVARAHPSQLRLTYKVTGRIGDLVLPEPGPPERADNLWQHTCLEAFLRPSPAPGYLEFNFAPSLRWAAYRFDAYRQGMRPAEPLMPRMKSACDGQTALSLDAVLALGTLAIGDTGPWRLGLAAVIEEKTGNKSYWALTHPQGKPDFHHDAGFVLDLPPERP